MSTASGERLRMLHESRKQLYSLPTDVLFELPGRPNVVYMIKDYSKDPTQGAQEARSEVSFLFKAFETGQIGPRRLARMTGEKPRASTIHEYLDWTVTAIEAHNEGEYDFSGFRLLLLYPRDRCMWPAPFQNQTPTPRAHPKLGAPLDPWPALVVKGKPLTAATIRSGPGYLEVPFVATHESKRGRGYGRCCVEAIEEVARALDINRLLLCSTCEEGVMNTWHHLGFQDSNEELLRSWDVQDADLVHMLKTLQMHKQVPPPRRWRPLVIRHQAFVGRTYMLLDHTSTRSRGNPGGGTQVVGTVSGWGFHNVSGTAGETSRSTGLTGEGGEQQQEAMSNWQQDAPAKQRPQKPPNKVRPRANGQQQQQHVSSRLGKPAGYGEPGGLPDGMPQAAADAVAEALAEAEAAAEAAAAAAGGGGGGVPAPVMAPGTPVQEQPPAVLSPPHQPVADRGNGSSSPVLGSLEAPAAQDDVEMADA